MGKIIPRPDVPVELVDPDSPVIQLAGAACDKRDAQEAGFQGVVMATRQLVRAFCPAYRNCREDDWCTFCSSGLVGEPFRGEVCLACRLFNHDSRFGMQPPAGKPTQEQEPAEVPQAA